MLPLLLVLEIVALLVVLNFFQPLVLSLLVRPIGTMSTPSVMQLIIACLPVLFGHASIVANEVLVIICPTVPKTLPIKILILYPLLLRLGFNLLLSPLLH